MARRHMRNSMGNCLEAFKACIRKGFGVLAARSSADWHHLWNDADIWLRLV